MHGRDVAYWQILLQKSAILVARRLAELLNFSERHLIIRPSGAVHT